MSRSIKLVLATSLVAVVLIPVAAVASHQFTDVPDSNIFHDDIAWLAENGVTLGCNPPANTRYCPSDNVTREQLAAFLRRLAENQVVDAKTLDGKGSAAFVEKGEADSVSPSMLTNPVGIAQALDGDPTALTTDTSPGAPAGILDVEIDLPLGPGFVLVEATFDAVLTHTNGVATSCALDVWEGPELPADGIVRNTNLPSTAPSGTYTFQGAVSRVFQVTGFPDPPGPSGWSFVGVEFSGDCMVDDIVLIATYVPVAHGPVDTGF